MMRHLLLIWLFVSSLEGVSPPEVCGDTERACIDGRSTCVDGQCRCNGPEYTWGNGRFMCYTAKEVAAEMKNCLVLTNFNGESTQFPYPCRFMLAHVRQNLKDRNQAVIGQCEFQVLVFNRKSKGKMYMFGFDIAIRLDYFTGRTEAFSLRRYGTEVTGITKEGTAGMYLPNGPWGDEHVDYEDDVNGVFITNSFHPQNKQTIFEASQCGLRVTFVPYDEVKRRHALQIPGLSVAVNIDHAPQWLSTDIVMGLPPVSHGGQKFADIQGFWLTVPQTAVARAFLSGIEQNQPGDASECAVVQQKMRACTDLALAEAMTTCFWMLRQPRFIKCFDKEDSANKLLSLFNK
ncbi:hypothetical protein RRG08_055500 [Elysia crispata]|uniref:VWFD domain-containing protein n=1 Tax=Elysia crispata TaxID=231223 RepID=A0AAE0YGU8_9GAST|nr:hypothetical protein RRG08_055500 [Elysia crispata]